MSISRAIAVGVTVLVSNCPTAPTSCRARDGEADGMQARGKELLDRRKFEEARVALDRALARHITVGDHAAASRDASLLAEVYQARSEYRAALLLVETARIEALSSGDRGSLATALIAQGSTLQRVGDLVRALAAYEEAVPNLPDSDKVGRSRLAIYRALVLRSQERLAAAEQGLLQARDLARQAGNHRLAYSACVNLADIALVERRLDDAERHLRDARAASRALGVTRPSTMILLNEAVLAQLRGDLSAAEASLDQLPDDDVAETAHVVATIRGSIAEAAGRLDAAEAHYRRAVDIVEQMRRDVAPEDAKAQFFEQRWAPYESLFALQLRRRDAGSAFATLALAQGRMFFDAFTASLVEEVPAPGSRIHGAIDRIDVLDQVMAPLADSSLARMESPEATLAALAGKRVLIYFPSGERLRMMKVEDGEPHITGVDIGLDRLDRLVDAFRNEPGDPAAAEALGSALLPPGTLPAGPARIHIVPTSPLLRVSFAALRPGGDRLLDRYEIAYAPSVTGLAAMTVERGARGGAGTVLADTRSRLRHAPSELKDVVAATGAIPHVGADATVAALRASAHGPLLHVISHSGLGVDGGYLALADGKVSAADIVASRIGPQLAVLPTCSSAATAGREMWGSLAAAFLAAGSTHVVATLNSVEDSVGLEFTRRFYRAGGARDPVGGTARAQREMAGRYPVAAWSSFVVAGL
jgi:tetratricopeptide (TPR) repeat protein